eukprot:6209250-Pleurochrysis_carterae.AAC.1
MTRCGCDYASDPPGRVTWLRLEACSFPRIDAHACPYKEQLCGVHSRGWMVINKPFILLSPSTKRQGLATIQLSSTLLKIGFEGPVRPF